VTGDSDIAGWSGPEVDVEWKPNSGMEPLVEKTVRVFSDPSAAEEADLDEWLALSPAERLMIGEELRLEAYGNPAQGLARVLELVDHEED